MKAQIIAIALLGLMLFAVPFALAETSLEAENSQIAEDSLSSNPGMTPDSAFYSLKLGWERARLAFTFNQEKKAQFELNLAERRLLEIRKMAEKGNVQAMEKAQARHDALIESAQARLSSIQEDTKEAQIRTTAEKVVGLERAILAHENRIEVLKDILSEQNLSDEARTAMESAVARMENRTQEMSQKLEEKKDRVKTRLRAVSGDNAEDVESAIEEIENKTGLTDLGQKIAQQRIERTEESLERVKARVAEEKAAGIDVSAAESAISEAESNLEEAKSLYAQGEYSSSIAAVKPVSNYGRNLSVVVRAINKARLENRLSEVKNLTDNFSQQRLQLREEVKTELKQRQQNWQNLSDETQDEIKGAIQTELEERLQERTGQSN